jgi:peptidoglycan/xylan/chitin deacetylase (PgdA/CDA1 family)
MTTYPDVKSSSRHDGHLSHPSDARCFVEGRRLAAKSTLKKCVLAAFGVTSRVAHGHGLLLTFDDGPDPQTTGSVLKLLAQYGARAVFFIVGNRIPRAPQMLPQIIAEGHIIGNHSYRHPLDYIPSITEYYQDLQECQLAFESHIGSRPRLFRPPLGTLTFAGLVAPRLLGLRTLMWSIDVDDWKLRHKEDAVHAGRRLAEIAGPGDIVLLHDDNPCVVTLLETALPILRERDVNLADALELVK